MVREPLAELGTREGVLDAARQLRDAKTEWMRATSGDVATNRMINAAFDVVLAIEAFDAADGCRQPPA